MNWPFELPPPNATARRALIDDECNHRGHEEVPAYTQEQVNACIIAALRWAARVAGPVSDKPCCGCIVESGEGGYYSQCDCGNYGDAERAAAWCADANTSRAILAALPKDEANAA